MPFDNLRRDIEAQSKTGIGAFAGTIHTEEAVEDAGLVGWGNPDSEVLHADGDVVGRVVEPDDDGVRARRVFHRIGQQVQDDLADAVSVADDGGRDVALDHDVVGVGRRLDVGDNLVDTLREAERPGLEF